MVAAPASSIGCPLDPFTNLDNTAELSSNHKRFRLLVEFRNLMVPRMNAACSTRATKCSESPHARMSSAGIIATMAIFCPLPGLKNKTAIDGSWLLWPLQGRWAPRVETSPNFPGRTCPHDGPLPGCSGRCRAVGRRVWKPLQNFPAGRVHTMDYRLAALAAAGPLGAACGDLSTMSWPDVCPHDGLSAGCPGRRVWGPVHSVGHHAQQRRTASQAMLHWPTAQWRRSALQATLYWPPGSIADQRLTGDAPLPVAPTVYFC